MFRCGNALIIKVVTIVPVREALPLKQGLRHPELILVNIKAYSCQRGTSIKTRIKTLLSVSGIFFSNVSSERHFH